MMDKLLTDEQIKEMVTKVWEAQEKTIRKDVEERIRQELATHVMSKLSRVVSSQLSATLVPLVAEAIAEAKPKIKEAVHATVAKQMAKIEEAAKREIKYALTSAHNDWLHEAVHRGE
jgi:uncharacterized membrane-anchored protein YjiN (DUF445 family)